MPCLIVGRGNTEDGLPSPLTLSLLVTFYDRKYSGSIQLIKIYVSYLNFAPYIDFPPVPLPCVKSPP